MKLFLRFQLFTAVLLAVGGNCSGETEASFLRGSSRRIFGQTEVVRSEYSVHKPHDINNHGMVGIGVSSFQVDSHERDGSSVFFGHRDFSIDSEPSAEPTSIPSDDATDQSDKKKNSDSLMNAVLGGCAAVVVVIIVVVVVAVIRYNNMHAPICAYIRNTYINTMYPNEPKFVMDDSVATLEQVELELYSDEPHMNPVNFPVLFTFSDEDTVSNGSTLYDITHDDLNEYSDEN